MLISSYIYIPVSDLEKAAGWYEKNLDFNVIYKDSLYFDMRTDNGVKIMLIPSEKNYLANAVFNRATERAGNH